MSLIQRQRDKPQAAPSIPRQDPNNSDPVTTGSSWLACLALLCQQSSSGHGFAASSTERLFAAQTLLHRVLRNPSHQAIDLEMEVNMEGDIIPLLFQQLQHPLPLREMLEQYQQYIHEFHPMIAAVIAQYQLHPQYDEDRVKGEIAMITLTAIMYNTANDIHHRDQNTNPILNSLGSAVAAIALRIRFTTNQIHSSNNAQHQQETPPPLVTMVTQALSLVFQTAASNKTLNLHASSDCLRACLAALPDICLGSSGGGARGRMSVDPKCIQEAIKELRTTGMNELWSVLQQHSQNMQQNLPNNNNEQQAMIHENILIICERWARFLPLPLEFIQHTVPLARQYMDSGLHHHHGQAASIRKAALSYLVAIFEGGTWTADKILAISLGLSPEQQLNQQASKKRQTSRSKKRQKEFLDTHSNDDMMEQANRECHHRGAMACHTAVLIWESLETVFRATLREDDASRQDTDGIEIEGEGPIGCLSACADACLPHLLRYSSSPTLAFPQSKMLFSAISCTFQLMCKSRFRVIRAFSMEPLYSLHKALIQHVLDNEQPGGHALDPELQSAVVEHFFKCSMSLATSCGYLSDYFHNLRASSDEELEIERNDVRDVLRAVTVSEGGGSTAFADCSRPPLDVTLQILTRILEACAEAVRSARNENRLFPETAVHCFSALAKPLNQLSKSYLKSGKPENTIDILKIAFHTLGTCLQVVVDTFHSTSLPDLFPASRVVDLAIASLSPMISNSCSNPALKGEVDDVVRLSLRAAALSIAHIPELAGESELGHQIYDIRGAMRGPGGEDHVGCLAIMRIAFESRELAIKMVDTAGSDIQYLCQLHSQLKTIEISREKDVFHGKGVTPKSRRILLGIICHLEIVTEGKAGCANMLTDLFDAAVTSIAQIDSASTKHHENTVFQMCENTWDLAAFSPVIISTLFNCDNDQTTTKRDCIRNLATFICKGYQRLALHYEVSPLDVQWNRLRAAFFTLLRTGASGDLANALVEIIEAINRAECEAIHIQCQAGKDASSSLFVDELVSEENIPTGLFVKVIGEYIDRVHSNKGEASAVQNCIAALHKSKPYVLSTITLSCPDPSGFIDPRPVLTEAWFLSMNSVINVVQDSQIDQAHMARELIVETCAVAVTLLFCPSMGKTREERSRSPVMSLEGPQTLALHDYLCSCFRLGPQMLQDIARELQKRVPIDTEAANVICADADRQSAAIIGSALFRAAQGGLPPWAVESAPAVYASLYVAFGKDVHAFCQMLQLALELRLSRSVQSFGSFQSGQLLAGPLFEGIKDSAKTSFLQQAMENCRKDDQAGWKRMKVLVKQISGGKKSNTDFTQKPSPTKFEFDRL